MSNNLEVPESDDKLPQTSEGWQRPNLREYYGKYLEKKYAQRRGQEPASSPDGPNEDSLSYQLYARKMIQFGDFTLKSGKKSSIYFDLRKLSSDPEFLTKVIREGYTDYVNRGPPNQFDLVCGVPTAGISLATAFSIHHNIPSIWVRKEAKEHGLRKMIEGDFKSGQRVLLLDDVITSGGSLLETIRVLEAAGLVVAECRVLIDRRPKGLTGKNHLYDDLETPGPSWNHRIWPLRCCLQMTQILADLDQIGVEIPVELREHFSFRDRASRAHNPVARRLMELMEEKQTNLVCSVDVTTSEELISLVRQVGPEVAMIKTHIDQITDFNLGVITTLLHLKKYHNFLILEDRKFSDIGNTVKNQYLHGVHRIHSWADLVTVHTVMGPGTINALYQAIAENKENLNSLPYHEHSRDRGLIPVIQASSNGNLMSDQYTQQSIAEISAQNNSPVIAGVVCQKQLLDDGFLHLTPGVNLDKGGDNLGQQYRTPETVIGQDGSDLIIVGRGIYQSDDPQAAAQEYRAQAWEAYQARIH